MSSTEIIMDVQRETKVAEFTKKEQMRCMFCGGSQCPKCSETAYLQLAKPAIDKLHSSWITDSILAMQRPSDSILDNGVLASFKSNKITAVFNLTQPGEHPYCGCGILSSSGFPYTPEKLMEAGIKHFNYSWQDMTVPSIALMNDIVNVACDEIAAGGKIAVHCHAGFGRTGLTIACVMIAKDHLESGQVIQFIRKRRPGSIQTSTQEKFIQRFERSYYHLMHVFPMMEITDKNANATSLYSKTIAQSVKDQEYVMTMDERKLGTYKFKHKLVHHVVSSLSKLSHEDFHLATLAITGLTKLVPKANRSESNGEELVQSTSMERLLSPSARTRAAKAAEEVKVTCLMVASNSLSESTEEPIMNEMKIEINMNNYSKLIQVADVVASDMISSKPTHSANVAVTPSTPKVNFTASPPVASPASTASKSYKSLKVLTDNVDIKMHESHDENSIEDEKITPIDSYLQSTGVKQVLSMDSTDNDRVGNSDKVGGSDKVGELVASPRDNLSPRVKHREHNDSIIVQDAKKLNPKLGMTYISPIAIASVPSEDSVSISNNVTTPGGSVTRAISLSKMRQNSLRANSASDYAKSKRLSTNLMGQMLLDWLETRRNPLFEDKNFEGLSALWKEFKKSAEVDTPFVKDKPANKTDVINSASDRLFQGLKNHLYNSMDRFKLELLSDIITMLRQFRVIGKQVYNGEVAPIDCLVGLRLAIACMHAKKQYFNLVKNRALNMDLVKSFLLKATHIDRVIINNITFSTEHYEVIKNTIGAVVLDNLELIINTFEVLIEFDWHFEVITENIVHWDEMKLAKTNKDVE